MSRPDAARTLPGDVREGLSRSMEAGRKACCARILSARQGAGPQSGKDKDRLGSLQAVPPDRGPAPTGLAANPLLCCFPHADLLCRKAHAPPCCRRRTWGFYRGPATPFRGQARAALRPDLALRRFPPRRTPICPTGVKTQPVSTTALPHQARATGLRVRGTCRGGTCAVQGTSIRRHPSLNFTVVKYTIV